MALSVKEIQDKADAIIAPLIADITALQDNWILTHKGYWQGIRTPLTQPKDGADVALSVVDKEVKPVADAEAASWEDTKISLPTSLPCSVEVYTHDGPTGLGYSIRVFVTFGIQIFFKSIGFGKESMDSGGWQEILPDPTIK